MYKVLHLFPSLLLRNSSASSSASLSSRLPFSRFLEGKRGRCVSEEMTASQLVVRPAGKHISLEDPRFGDMHVHTYSRVHFVHFAYRCIVMTRQLEYSFTRIRPAATALAERPRPQFHTAFLTPFSERTVCLMMMHNAWFSRFSRSAHQDGTERTPSR